jgi:hypothetical protein
MIHSRAHFIAYSFFICLLFAFIVGAESLLLLKLPFLKGESFLLTQGYDEGTTHKRTDSFALDFTQNGCDAYGKSVLAVADGKVKLVRLNDKYYGNEVIIEHADNSLESVYAHLSEISVLEGREVKQGEAIGLLGNSGNVFGTACKDHPGAHLHFVMYQEVKQDDGTIKLSSYRPEPMSGYGDGRAKGAFASGQWYESDNSIQNKSWWQKIIDFILKIFKTPEDANVVQNSIAPLLNSEKGDEVETETENTASNEEKETVQTPAKTARPDIAKEWIAPFPPDEIMHLILKADGSYQEYETWEDGTQKGGISYVNHGKWSWINDNAISLIDDEVADNNSTIAVVNGKLDGFEEAQGTNQIKSTETKIKQPAESEKPQSDLGNETITGKEGQSVETKNSDTVKPQETTAVSQSKSKYQIAGKVTAFVVDQHGNPVKAISYWLEDDRRNKVCYGFLDCDGNLTNAGYLETTTVPKEGEYILKIKGYFYDDFAQKIKVPEEGIFLDKVIVKQPSRLKGFFVDQKGDPVAHCFYWFIDAKGHTSGLWSGYQETNSYHFSSDTGHFETLNIADGTYQFVTSNCSYEAGDNQWLPLEDLNKTVTVSGNDIDLGKIILKPKASSQQ